MRPDYPDAGRIPGLRQLWKKAFGDTDAFLDVFFATGYRPDRCRCITEGNQVQSALYWFACTCSGQKLAYIYAVATDPDCRGRGLCRLLMEDTAAVLAQGGYDGAILMPQDAGLRTMYSRMGYVPATTLEEVLCIGSPPCPVTEITASEYAAKRTARLPEGSVLPGAEAVDFLGRLARFYISDGFLAAVSREEEHLRVLEYLGDRAAMPALVAALGRTEATIRLPGSGMDFAMYLPLTQTCRKPEYYPFAFD